MSETSVSLIQSLGFTGHPLNQLAMSARGPLAGENSQLIAMVPKYDLAIALISCENHTRCANSQSLTRVPSVR